MSGTNLDQLTHDQNAQDHHEKRAASRGAAGRVGPERRQQIWVDQMSPDAPTTAISLVSPAPSQPRE